MNFARFSRLQTANKGRRDMLVVGLALLATSIVMMWLCLAGSRSGVKSYLRGGGDIVAAIIFTGCFGTGFVVIFVSLTR